MSQNQYCPHMSYIRLPCWHDSCDFQTAVWTIFSLAAIGPQKCEVSMTTREFIMLMESSLRGEVSEAVIQENINYYEGYIREQIAAGRNEQEVLEMLGDPRLIARTIIDTNGGDGSYQTSGQSAYGYSQYTGRYNGTSDPNGSSDGRKGYHVHHINGSKWYVKALAIAIPILLICVVISVIMGILGLIMRFAVPIIIILLVIYLVKRILQ